MQFWTDLYVSDNISEDENHIRRRISAGKCKKTWFVICISSMRDGMLEILPGALIGYSWFDRDGLQVVGVARGYYHAMGLIRDIAADVYEKTGDCRLKEYFLAGMEKDKE